jgi:ferredoxin
VTSSYPQFDCLSIWFFSGTGNAQFAAEQIKANAEKLAINATVQRMLSKKSNFDPFDENTLIGFCYPTHGFNAPPSVLKFLWHFPKGKNKVFLLNTRAGLKLYKIHLPGIGGIALWLPALIMFLKGYKPIGFRPLDMPSNWISLHPGIREKVIESIKKHCTCTLERFSKRILTGKPVLNGFLWFPVDIALIPISIAYYLGGRFFIAKTFFANYNCNSCGLCIKQCPVKAIVEKDKRPYWTFNCESCMKCMNSCPKRAIETAHGFTFLLWWTIFSALSGFVVKLIVHYNILPIELIQGSFGLVQNAITIIISFAIVYIAYRLLHQLLGLKLINRIITYTSLTHFKFWRRYYNNSVKILD